MEGNYFWDKPMGDLTLISAESLLNFDLENKHDRNQYMQIPENFSTFPLGLLASIKNKYGDVGEEGLLPFIKQCGQKRNVELPIATIDNWITGKVNPQESTRSRESMYKLCFALGFDANETADFFSKVYLSRPFECREVTEAVYLFCMNHGISYKKTQELIEKAKDICKTIDETAEFLETRLLFNQIVNISSEKDLFTFIETNKTNFIKRNSTAVKYYEQLKNKAKELAGVKSNEGLLNQIYDKSLRDSEGGKHTIHSESLFLARVKQNFPQKQQLYQIEKGDAKFDTIRKALILLKFYTFFMQVGNNNSEEDFEEFCLETDDMLNECGYALMYARNPYDWVFLHCAACSHDRDIDVNIHQPLDELRDIIDDMLCFE